MGLTMVMRWVVLLLLVEAACGPAPSVPTPGVTIVYITQTPQVATATPEAPQPLTATPPGPFPAASVAWLKSRAIPFANSDPNGSFDDLQPLRAIIGPAQVVALGEATHGTHEFFEMKHRILKFLVTQMGFTTFAIEANWPEANLINQYIHTGNGDPAQLLAGLGFWTWDTQEVLDMIVWMRQYNATVGSAQKLSFYGFDMQTAGLAMDQVIAYLRTISPASADQAEKGYACLRPYQTYQTAYGYRHLSAADQSACRHNLQQVYDAIQSQPPASSDAQATSNFRLALQSARVVLQAEDFHLTQSGSITSTVARDHYMAENVNWIVQQAGPGAKVVLWAHNMHVGAIQDTATGQKSMGSYLRGTYGSNLVIFGFSLYAGAFNAYSNANDLAPQAHKLPFPIPNSYESYFHTANLPRFFLDLRGLSPDTAATTWLLGPHPFYSLGNSYIESATGAYVRSARLPEEYDVVVYYQDTTPSRLLPFPGN